MRVLKKISLNLGVLVAAVAIVATSGAAVYAANNSNLSQQINTGTLSTDIMNASRVAVATPGVTMTAKNFSFDCQNAGNASTGTLGTNTERLYVTNPDGADNGWTLTIAATAATSRWQNTGATSFIDFNDPTTSGCADGADTDTTPGQLTLNPAAGTITTDCTSCTNTSVTAGTSGSFNQGTLDSITLINAAAASNDVWRGYLTGVGVSQVIPAETPADTYTLNLTLTATAS